MAVNPKASEPPSKQAKQLQCPVSKEALMATKSAIDAQLTTKLEKTADQINEAWAMALNLIGNREPTAAVIQEVRDTLKPHIDITEMADNLMVHIQQAYDLMLSICPNKAPYTKTYLTRTVGREYEKLNTQIIELKRIRQEANIKQTHPQCTYTKPTTQVAKNIMEEMPEEDSRPAAWLQKLGNAIVDTQKQMDKIRMDFNREKWEAGKKTYSTKLAKQPKVMNRQIFNKNEGNPTSPTVLKDKEGQAHTCSEELLDIMT